MATLAAPPRVRNAEIFYPDSDGRPMADNTLQYEWIEKIKGGCEALFADNAEVFVAGDLLWYPVEGKPKVCAAPDVLVVFGRPKGYRGAYIQHEEDGIAPQVVFEILSPGNSAGEMTAKALFYDRYKVEEYYLYDPETVEFDVFLRDENGVLTQTGFDKEFVSPRLGVRFALPDDAEALVIYRPDGERFKSYVELAAERNIATAERNAIAFERDAVTVERDAATAERDAEKARAERLAARLRELGVEPD